MCDAAAQIEQNFAAAFAFERRFAGLGADAIGTARNKAIPAKVVQ